MDIFHIDAEGPPRQLDSCDTLPPTGFLWLDFARDTEPSWHETAEALVRARFHDRHIQDSLNAAHPSFFDNTADYDMVIFRSLALAAEDAGFSTHPTAFFVFDRLLVTVQSGDSRSIQRVKERLHEQAVRQLAEPAALMHLILNNMVDRFLALREPLSARMEVWVEQLLDPRQSFSDWYTVLGHRRELRKLEMLCEEQEDAILSWRDNARHDISEHLNVRYTDLLEHIRRVDSFATIQQREAETLVQLHFSATAHRTNEIMRVLTVLSAIFLPLTLIAGIYGMNFERMPELHTRYGYFFVLGGMTLLAVLLLVWFRIKRWF
jgi:magnesium/cobalt transport protein CorA